VITGALGAGNAVSGGARSWGAAGRDKAVGPDCFATTEV
jgi:hypothetical protein